MTTFLLDGKPEDMNWRKSLNSYERRDSSSHLAVDAGGQHGFGVDQLVHA